MELTGLTTDTSTFPSGEAAQGSNELGKDAFMELLVSQMQHQDPLDPQSNDQFIAQLASFSSLEQMENMNDNLLTMALLQDNNALMSQLTTGSSLIGTEVQWSDPLTGGTGSGIVDKIKVQDGLSYLTVGTEEVPLQIVTEVSGGVSNQAADTDTEEN